MTAPANHALAEVCTIGVRRYAAVCTCGKRCRGGSRSVARAGLDAHIAHHTPDPCPTPGKAGYTTEADAQAALGRAWRRQGAGKRPTRVYLCPGCAEWHLTAKPVRGGHDQ